MPFFPFYYLNFLRLTRRVYTIVKLSLGKSLSWLTVSILCKYSIVIFYCYSFFFVLFDFLVSFFFFFIFRFYKLYKLAAITSSEFVSALGQVFDFYQDLAKSMWMWFFFSLSSNQQFWWSNFCGSTLVYCTFYSYKHGWFDLFSTNDDS